MAYLERQHERLACGAGYSFAIADAHSDEAVGQIGLWTGKIGVGRASTGYWIGPQFRRRSREPHAVNLRGLPDGLR